MRPDKLHLVVDPATKRTVSHVNGTGIFETVSTMERVGLSRPFSELPIAKDDE